MTMNLSRIETAVPATCIDAQESLQIANGLFADGASAMLVSQRPGWAVRASGSQRLPDSEGELDWSIGDHGFQSVMTKQTPRVYSYSSSSSTPATE